MIFESYRTMNLYSVIPREEFVYAQDKRRVLRYYKSVHGIELDPKRVIRMKLTGVTFESARESDGLFQGFENVQATFESLGGKRVINLSNFSRRQPTTKDLIKLVNQKRTRLVMYPWQ